MPRTSAGAEIKNSGNSTWRLTIPKGSKSTYRLAQLDDYMQSPRAKFRWEPPVRVQLSARVSRMDHKGTWGFGFWNDPFSMNLGLQGTSRRLPDLPNTAWFFFASPENHLAIRETLPGNGMLSAVFSSAQASLPLRAFAGVFMPLAFSGLTSGLLRKILKRLINEDAIQINKKWEEWQQFSINWLSDKVKFSIDGNICHECKISPQGKLGFLIWMDNQFASFAPRDRLKFGTLETFQETSLEIKDLSINPINLGLD